MPLRERQGMPCRQEGASAFKDEALRPLMVGS